jgi:hypothetical protein
MKIMIESTTVTTRLDNVPVRLWEGTTEDGIPCKVFIHRIAVANEQDATVFEQELERKLAPGRYIPLSMAL